MWQKLGNQEVRFEEGYNATFKGVRGDYCCPAAGYSQRRE